jgi:hypothetical protein
MKISLRKVGGLRFLKIGRLTLMGCWSRKPKTLAKPARTIWTLDEEVPRYLHDKSYPCPAAWRKLRQHWDEEARRLHDNLSR